MTDFTMHLCNVAFPEWLKSKQEWRWVMGWPQKKKKKMQMLKTEFDPLGKEVR